MTGQQSQAGRRPHDKKQRCRHQQGHVQPMTGQMGGAQAPLTLAESVQGQQRLLNNLTIAFELDPDYKELVHKEHDFDPIRDNPDFRQLTAMLV